METREEVINFIIQKIDEKNLSMNNISLELGMNASYMYSFLYRNTPKRLPEQARKKLAIILETEEQNLTDIKIDTIDPLTIAGAKLIGEKVAAGISHLFRKASDNSQELVSVDMLDTTACCGNGIETLSENIVGKWLMPLLDYRKISSTTPENVKMIKVKGDSMQPTLKEDDWVLVDTSQNFPSDGMFLLRLAGNFLTVKRIQCGFGNNITILSDNPNYQPMNATIDDATIVGKVIYALKAEKVG